MILLLSLVLGIVLLAASYVAPNELPGLVARYPFVPKVLLGLGVASFLLAVIGGAKGVIPRDGGPRSI